MILILSKEDDAHVTPVVDRLKVRDVGWWCFNPAHFPANAEIRIEYEAGEGLSRRLLRYQDRTVDLATVTAVWYRRPCPPSAPAHIRDEGIRDWIATESRHLLTGLWETLDCLWIPGKPSDLAAAENKIHQLALAACLGFTIPRTVVANSPRAFRDFYTACTGAMITKTSEPEVFIENDRYLTGYTHVVKRDDLVNHRSISLAPIIMQEYVVKQVEIRATVVGSRVFAAEIHSQASRSTRFDWRRYDLDRTPHIPHQLPSSIEDLCIQLVRSLRLTFGAIDMVLTPSGEYVFLEINPNGQWGWIEDLTGLPIADAIVDLLLAGPAGFRYG